MRHFSAHSMLLSFPIVAVCTLALASPLMARADEGVKPPHKTSLFPARSLKITRSGGGYARPDSATMRLHFKVEGADWKEMEKNQAALIETLGRIVAPFDSARNLVSIEQGGSGQSIRDGTVFPKMEGTLSIRVHNLAVLKAIGRQIAKATSEEITVAYQTTSDQALQQAMIHAQQNAVLEARKQGDFLAKAAGTRIVGVLELREGQVHISDMTADAASVPEDWKIPRQVLAAYAEVTINFEMAPPEIETKAKAASAPRKKPIRSLSRSRR